MTIVLCVVWDMLGFPLLGRKARVESHTHTRAHYTLTYTHTHARAHTLIGVERRRERRERRERGILIIYNHMYTLRNPKS